MVGQNHRAARFCDESFPGGLRHVQSRTEADLILIENRTYDFQPGISIDLSVRAPVIVIKCGMAIVE